MPLVVTILREQLEEVRRVARTRHLRVLKGIAFAWPGEDAAHCFFSRPGYTPGGDPTPCFFAVPQPMGGPLKAADAAALALAAGAGEGALVVALDPLHDDRCAVYGIAAPHEAQRVQVVSVLADTRSRHAALLDNEALAAVRVLIVGVGSFGSSAAVELAKAGVASFSLIDPDRLEPGNICRHACGLSDLGRYKTRAVRDAIHQRNPGARVDTHEVDVNEQLELLRVEARGATLMLCLTDGNRSRFNCNAAAIAAGRPAIFARAITRAAGGDVFIYRPGGPCLACLFSQDAQLGQDELSNRRQAEASRPAYAAPGDTPEIQPGLACDIAPILQMTVKLALAECMRGRGGALWTHLAEDLEAPFYIWANRREMIYEKWEPMRFSFNRNSILRWYGVRVPRVPDCLSCGLS